MIFTLKDSFSLSKKNFFCKITKNATFCTPSYFYRLCFFMKILQVLHTLIKSQEIGRGVFKFKNQSYKIFKNFNKAIVLMRKIKHLLINILANLSYLFDQKS